MLETARRLAALEQVNPPPRARRAAPGGARRRDLAPAAAARRRIARAKLFAAAISARGPRTPATLPAA